jgi:tRNA-dihydrouridine synthase A
MDYTNRHQRYLQRLMSKHTVLYTEMVTTNALVRSGDPERFLHANLDVEDPVVLQLGGSDVEQMKEASKLAYAYGYKEINLNVGCPSPKVAGAGCFGAALMLNPSLVADLACAIGDAGGVPATIKCRIGVDDEDSYEQLVHFIRTVSERAGVKHFIVHARKAILNKNFSPKDNRTIPPLRYAVVYRLVQDFPHLCFTLNGGLLSMEMVRDQFAAAPGLFGVMVGRAVVEEPFAWCTVDSELFACDSNPG